MAKYKCQCDCDAIIEIKDSKKVPECCGKPMKKVSDDEKVSRKGCGCCQNFLIEPACPKDSGQAIIRMCRLSAQAGIRGCGFCPVCLQAGRAKQH